jgi:hypothetical protein
MKRAQPANVTEPASPTTTHTFQFSPERDTIVVDVIEAVAAVASIEPRQFEPRLYEAIDPDALTKCVRSGGSAVRVSFRLGEYDVTVRGSGEILVDPV